MIRLLILSAFLLSALANAQEADPDAEETAAAEEASATDESSEPGEVSDDEIEDLLGLDEEDYSEIEEDDFDASVEVRYEQSVPFPTDI